MHEILPHEFVNSTSIILCRLYNIACDRLYGRFGKRPYFLSAGNLSNATIWTAHIELLKTASEISQFTRYIAEAKTKSIVHFYDTFLPNHLTILLLFGILMHMGVFFEKIELSAGQSFRFLKWTDNVSQVEICPGQGDAIKISGAGEQWHFHPEMELTLITHGTGIRFVGDHIEAFQSPDLVLIGKNLPHYWSDLHKSSGYAIQFSLEKSNPLWQLKETEELIELCNQASRGIHYSKKIAQSLINKCTLMEQISPAKQLALFVDILDELNHCPESELSVLSKKDFSISVTTQYLKGLNDAILYLLDHFDQKIDLDDMLHITHMSKSTFCRQFKCHTGKTFKEFLNELRIDHSCRLLVETLESITKIAYQVGFRNLSHFNRKFLQHCGITPKTFRDRFKK